MKTCFIEYWAMMKWIETIIWLRAHGTINQIPYSLPINKQPNSSLFFSFSIHFTTIIEKNNSFQFLSLFIKENVPIMNCINWKIKRNELYNLWINILYPFLKKKRNTIFQLKSAALFFPTTYFSFFFNYLYNFMSFFALPFQP